MFSKCWRSIHILFSFCLQSRGLLPTQTEWHIHSYARLLTLVQWSCFPYTQTLACWLFPMFIKYIYVYSHLGIMILLGTARKVGKRMMEQTAHDSEQENERKRRRNRLCACVCVGLFVFVLVMEPFVSFYSQHKEDTLLFIMYLSLSRSP